MARPFPLPDEEEILALLRDLIRAASPTPPGDVTAAANVVRRILDKEGIPLSVHTAGPGIDNIIARVEGGEPGPLLLFNGHLDTVPPGRGWRHPPLAAEFIDGEVHGRGAVDMKGGLAAALAALIGLGRSGSRFSGAVVLAAVGDEENHGRLGTKYLLNQGLLKADAAVCCEPTGLELELGNRGLMMVEVLIRGRSCHAGRPHLGVNAVHLAARVVRAVENWRPSGPENRLFEIPHGSRSVVGISGGDRQNVIPDSCLIHIDCRLMPGQSGPEALAGMAGLIGEAVGETPEIVDYSDSDPADVSDAPLVIRPEYWHEPFWTPEQTPIAGLARRVIAGELGREPVVRGKAAGTDASHLVYMGDIPTIIFGPGDPHLSHTNRERVALADVVAAARVYRNIIAGFAAKN